MTNRAELFVRTDVDPAHEGDFNAWYDTEHMEERVGIKGFRWGRRYQALDGKMPRYLALYQTMGLAVFTSEPYQAAFGVQTQWSVTNLGRMRNTSRRVCEVVQEVGAGTGGALALVELGVKVPEGVGQMMQKLETRAGIVEQRVLVPDAVLSTPLPAEPKEGRVLSAFLVVEGSSEGAVKAAAAEATGQLGLSADAARCYGLLWELRAEDIVR